MNERTTLGFDIQVRLDKILGLEKFSEVKQAIQDQVQPTGENIQSIFDSQKSMEAYKDSVLLSKELGYNSNQKLLSALTEPQAQTAFNRAQDQISNLWDQITNDTEKRKKLGQEPITASRLSKYKEQFGDIYERAQGVFNQRIQAIETKFGKDDPLVQAQTDLLTRGLDKLKEGFKDNIDALDDYYEALKKGDTGLKGLIQSLSLLGTIGGLGSFAIKGLGLYEEGQIIEKQVERQHALAFDLTSPINTYQMNEQADLFERQRQRSYKAKTDSYLYGGIGAVGVGAGLSVAMVAGAPITVPLIAGATALTYALGSNAFSTYLGGEAEQENIYDDQQVQEKLRTLNQSNQIINSAVQKYRNYDIARTQEQFRFGSEAGKRVLGNLGYTADQEVAYETAFGESLGRYDKDLFLEQTRIGRGLGIDPRALYGLNRTTQLTGVEFDSKFIAQADILRKQLYGENSDNKKLVDVLTASKDILEKILNVNVEGNKDQVFQFANLPRMIFGENNAYGRIDLMGGRTLSAMEGLMKPTSLAHEAFLYQALQPKDLIEFQEMLKGGLLGNDQQTRNKLFEGLRSAGQVLNRTSLYGMLDEMMPNAPKGMITQFTDLFQKGEIEVDGKKVTLDGILKGTDEKGKEFIDKLSKQMLEQGDKSISQSEAILTAIDNVQKEIGTRWNKTMGDMELKTQNAFKKLSDSADTFQKLTDAFNKGYEQLTNTMAKLGMLQLGDFTHAYASDMTKELTKYIYSTLDKAGKKYNADDWTWSKLAPNGNFEEYFNAVANKLEVIISGRDIRGGEKLYKKEFLEQDTTQRIIKDYNNRIPALPGVKEDETIRGIERRAKGDLSSNNPKFDESLNHILNELKIEIANFNKSKNNNVQLNIISSNPSENWELQETSYDNIG